MERIWHRTRDFEANGMKPEEFTKDSLLFRGNPLDAHALMRQLKRMGPGKMEIDDGGSMHGVLKIDGRQVKVSVHKIGMDGEALISFYPLIEDMVEAPPFAQEQPVPVEQPIVEQPPVPGEQPPVEQEPDDKSLVEPDVNQTDDMGDEAYDGSKLGVDEENTENDDDKVKGNKPFQPSEKVKRLLSETP
jgi:hypothetical protein